MKRNVLLLTLLFNLEKINCITGSEYVLICLSSTGMLIGLGAFCRTQVCDCTSTAEDNICAKGNRACDECLRKEAEESKPLLKNKGTGTGAITQQPTAQS